MHPRLTSIIDLAQKGGKVEVEKLAQHFDVSSQTIRKDLNDLCNQELLTRFHGGAVFPNNLSNITYSKRQILAADGKHSIATKAAELIPSNSSLILNIGTTTEKVAQALTHHKELLVITNNLNVAFILSNAANVELIVAGGMVRKSDGGILGAAAIELIQQFKVDFAIIGASAIDVDGCLLDYDYLEVKVSQAIMEQARKIILVADKSKFERKAPVKIAHLSAVDVFITDQQPADEIQKICDENNVEIIIAEE